MSAALTLLGQDIDDGWTGTTTSAGNANKLTLEDTNLYEKVADWVCDGMVIYITSGTDSGKTRVVDSLSGSTLTVKNTFSALIAKDVTYEIHRLFTRSQKLTALRNAATLICPEIHAVVRDRSKKIVANQYEYDISSLALYQNRPHQVLLAQKTIKDVWVKSTAYAKGDYVRPTLLSTFSGYIYKCTTAGTSGSSEPTWPTTADGTVVDGSVTWTCQADLDYSNYPMLPLHDWDITPDGHLFLNSSYTAGYKLMIVGIKPLAFTGSDAAETIAIDSPFDLVLSAQAAQYLWKQRAGSAGAQDIEQATRQVQNWAQELATRKAQYWMAPPTGTLITGPGLTV